MTLDDLAVQVGRNEDAVRLISVRIAVETQWATTATPFAIRHKFNETPDHIICEEYGDAKVWADENDRKRWTTDTLWLQTNAAAPVRFDLFLFKFARG